jgi:integrase
MGSDSENNYKPFKRTKGTLNTKGKPYYHVEPPRKAKPSSKYRPRKTFVIQAKWKDEEGKNKKETIRNAEIDQINKLFLAGEIDFDRAKTMCMSLKDQLVRERDKDAPLLLCHEDNIRLFEKMWEDKYIFRTNKDLKGTRRSIIRAMEVVGHLSIETATRNQILERVKKQVKAGEANEEHTLMRLKEFFKYAGRTDELPSKLTRSKSSGEVKHLTVEEFNQVVPHIKDPLIKLLSQVAFATGMRTGEIFAIHRQDVSADMTSIFLKVQISRKREEEPPKREKTRRLLVLPWGIKYLKELLEKYPEPMLLKKRNEKLAEQFKLACQAAFPDDRRKHLVFHDNRHSYAIFLLSEARLNITEVALMIGDSVKVTQNHYVGHVLNDNSLENLKNILHGKKEEIN